MHLECLLLRLYLTENDLKSPKARETVCIVVFRVYVYELCNGDLVNFRMYSTEFIV